MWICAKTITKWTYKISIFRRFLIIILRLKAIFENEIFIFKFLILKKKKKVLFLENTLKK